MTDNTHVKPDTPAIKVIDREFVRKTAEDAVSDLEHGHEDNALTLARTLLEEVCCKMTELRGEAPNKSENISVLFGQIQRLYFGDVASTAEGKELEKLLNGYNRIQLAVADLRNAGSTSHGAGTDRVNIDDHYVRLFVNSSLTLAEFMLEVLERSHIELRRVLSFLAGNVGHRESRRGSLSVSRHKQSGFSLNTGSGAPRNPIDISLMCCLCGSIEFPKFVLWECGGDSPAFCLRR